MDPGDAPDFLIQMDVDNSGGVTEEELRNFQDKMALKKRLHEIEQNLPPGTIGISRIMGMLHNAGQDPQLGYGML